MRRFIFLALEKGEAGRVDEDLSLSVPMSERVVAGDSLKWVPNGVSPVTAVTARYTTRTKICNERALTGAECAPSRLTCAVENCTAREEGEVEGTRAREWRGSWVSQVDLCPLNRVVTRERRSGATFGRL